MLPHVVEALLNHISGHRAGVARVYNRATYSAEKRAALELWNRRVAQIAGSRMSKEDLVRQLIEDVTAEHLTPSQADEIVEGCGFGPLEGQDWHVDFSDPQWPLSFAALWIAWRDPEVLAKQWDRFRFWSGHFWRDHVREAQRETLERAEFLLWKGLKSGTIRAQGLPFQDSDAVDIPRVHWLNLQWMPVGQRCPYETLAGLSHGIESSR